MKLSIFATFWVIGSAAADCSGDNCANHVTGSWLGIGVPIETRLSLCNSFLRTTIKLPKTTVTTTLTKYTTDLSDVTTSDSSVVNHSITTRVRNHTIFPTAIPTFAGPECPDKGQFSSACACWANVTAKTTTLPQPTHTATKTVYANVGCGPAATSVAGKSNGTTYFPCSRQWGTCSCLLSGRNEVCVRVGPFSSGKGNLTSGPCNEAEECDSHGECGEGHICVFDGSCDCGKKRCYKAAPLGCDYQGLPMEISMMKKQKEEPK